MRHCYSSCFFPLSFLVKTIPFGIVLKISMLCVEVYLGTCYQLSWSYFQYFQDSFEESWKHLLNVRIHQSFHYWWNGFMDYWWQLFLIPVSFPLKVFFFEIIANVKEFGQHLSEHSEIMVLSCHWELGSHNFIFKAMI